MHVLQKKIGKYLNFNVILFIDKFIRFSLGTVFCPPPAPPSAPPPPEKAGMSRSSSALSLYVVLDTILILRRVSEPYSLSTISRSFLGAAADRLPPLPLPLLHDRDGVPGPVFISQADALTM